MSSNTIRNQPGARRGCAAKNGIGTIRSRRSYGSRTTSIWTTALDPDTCRPHSSSCRDFNRSRGSVGGRIMAFLLGHGLHSIDHVLKPRLTRDRARRLDPCGSESGSLHRRRLAAVDGNGKAESASKPSLQRDRRRHTAIDPSSCSYLDGNRCSDSWHNLWSLRTRGTCAAGARRSCRFKRWRQRHPSLRRLFILPIADGFVPACAPIWFS